MATAAIRDDVANDPSELQQQESGAPANVDVHEVGELKDCSFETSPGVIIKEVIKPGLGAWYEKPPHSAMVSLRIEEAWPLGNQFHDVWIAPRLVEVRLGTGELCDALEKAVPDMKRQETAIVRCSDETLCFPGEPQLRLPPDARGNGGLAFRVTLIDFNGGLDDVFKLMETDQSEYLADQKATADILLADGRHHLANEIYTSVLAHCVHQEKRGMETSRHLATPCFLNQALCLLKLQDVCGVLKATDGVLTREPENRKAWFRRAQAYIVERNFVEASKALRRLEEIEPDNASAKGLLKKVRAWQRAEEKEQMKATNFPRLLGSLRDHRSIKPDYLKAEIAPLPKPDEEEEGPLIGKCGYD